MVIYLSAGPWPGWHGFIARWAGFCWAGPDFRQDPYALNALHALYAVFEVDFLDDRFYGGRSASSG